MAQRRMFSLKIVDTDEFIDMPTSSRLLYYDLSMRADDDGFIGSPNKIIKMTGASKDDFRVLESKRFIMHFESGICVIKDWKVHNYIQKDRYQETIYQQEKKQLLESKNGSYEQCVQNVSKMDTQVRLGKDRLEKGKSKDRDIKTVSVKKKLASKKYKHPKYTSISLTKEQVDKLELKHPPQVLDLIFEKLHNYKSSSGKKYKSDYHAILSWVEDSVTKNQKTKNIENHIDQWVKDMENARS